MCRKVLSLNSLQRGEKVVSVKASLQPSDDFFSLFLSHITPVNLNASNVILLMNFRVRSLKVKQASSAFVFKIAVLE